MFSLVISTQEKLLRPNDFKSLPKEMGQIVFFSSYLICTIYGPYEVAGYVAKIGPVVVEFNGEIKAGSIGIVSGIVSGLCS
jgi:hypothetical protein